MYKPDVIVLYFRQAIIQACRNFKLTFHEARERASKALGFAKMLRKVTPLGNIFPRNTDIKKTFIKPMMSYILVQTTMHGILLKRF